MIEGQTNIEPCAICGELAEALVEISPPRHDSRGRFIDRRTRWLCGLHRAAAERDIEAARWRRSEKAARSKRFKRLQEIGTLFDGDAGAPAGTGRRDD